MIKLRQLLFENVQLAKKLYIDTNKLDQRGVTFLDNLSGGDYTFKTLADLYLEDPVLTHNWNSEDWNKTVTQLRNYNKNVFPIENFSFDSKSVTVTRRLFRDRAEILRIVNSWPSIAKRNLKKDIATPRNAREFHKLRDTIDYIDSHLKYLNNRSDEVKQLIYQKIFSSNNSTFEEVLNFVEDKGNLMYNKTFTKDELYQLVAENDYDLHVVYDKNNIVIVDVTGQPGIKTIGCNSLWCFTYGSEYGLAGEQWDQFSYNGHVYAIINFSIAQDDPEFINIVTKPFSYALDTGAIETDDSHVYNMMNDQHYGNTEQVVRYLINNDSEALKVFKFEDL